MKYPSSSSKAKKLRMDECVSLDDSGFGEEELDINSYNHDNASNQKVFNFKLNKENQWLYFERFIEIKPIGFDSSFKLKISTIFNHTIIKNTTEGHNYLVIEHGCSITKNEKVMHEFTVATEQLEINYNSYFVSNITIKNGQVLTKKHDRVFKSGLFNSESAIESKSLDKLSNEASKNPSKKHAINDTNFIIRKAVDSLNKQYKSSKDSKTELIKTDFQKFQEGAPISDLNRVRFYIKFGYSEDRLPVVINNDEYKDESLDFDQAKEHLCSILEKNKLINEIQYSNSSKVIIDILTKFSYFAIKDQEDKTILEDIEEFIQEELAAANNPVDSFDQIS